MVVCGPLRTLRQASLRVWIYLLLNSIWEASPQTDHISIRTLRHTGYTFNIALRSAKFAISALKTHTGLDERPDPNGPGKTPRRRPRARIKIYFNEAFGFAIMHSSPYRDPELAVLARDGAS